MIVTIQPLLNLNIFRRFMLLKTHVILTMDISAAPGQVVQGGSQLPSDRGVGQGRAFGKPGQASACWLPEMLVVAAEGLVDVE